MTRPRKRDDGDTYSERVAFKAAARLIELDADGPGPWVVRHTWSVIDEASVFERVDISDDADVGPWTRYFNGWIWQHGKYAHRYDNAHEACEKAARLGVEVCGVVDVVTWTPDLDEDVDSVLERWDQIEGSDDGEQEKEASGVDGDEGERTAARRRPRKPVPKADGELVPSGGPRRGRGQRGRRQDVDAERPEAPADAAGEEPLRFVDE